MTWWYSFLGIFLSILAAGGNGLVIYLIARTRRLHNPANWIIFSLAVADFFTVSTYLFTEFKSSCDANLRYSVISSLYAASAANLCLMTLDRYVFITKPLRHNALMTKKRVFFMIFTAWIASFFPHFVFYLMYRIRNDPGDTRRFKIFDFVVFEMFPPVVLSLATGHIFCIVRRKARQMAAQMAQLRLNQNVDQYNAECSTQHQRTSSMKVIIIAVTVFVICYINEVIYTVLYQLRDKEEKEAHMLALNLLYVVNSAINPLAYALFKSDIKKSLKAMVHCRAGTSKVKTEQFRAALYTEKPHIDINPTGRLSLMPLLL